MQKSIIIDYLKMVLHPKSEIMEKKDIEIMKMDWRTETNVIDCAVFTMRHMETYMGGGVRHWDAGLQAKGKQQKMLLNRLRQKYTAKFIMSTINSLREDVIARCIDWETQRKEKEMKKIMEKEKQKSEKEEEKKKKEEKKAEEERKKKAEEERKKKEVKAKKKK